MLGKHEVEFQVCPKCESMQTETPYWLDESYADGRRLLDVNAAHRAITWHRLIRSLYRAFGLPLSAPLLDWGAGDGLLVRLLRDVGINARYYDPLATNHYASGFESEPTDSDFSVISAFEVWEHLSRPREELDEALEKQPLIYVASTEIYTGQGDDWPYLNLLTGRHVFFYSAKAVAMIAERHNYAYHISHGKRIMLYRASEFSDAQAKQAKRVLDDRRPRLKRTLHAMRRHDSLALEDRKYVESLVRAQMAEKKREVGNGA